MRVEEAEAVVVRELFAQYLEPGGSRAGLAKPLYRLGVPSPTGKRCWYPNTIRLILTNPASTGQVDAGRRRTRPAGARWSALRPVGRRGESDTPAPPETWLAVAPIPAVVSQDQFDQVRPGAGETGPEPAVCAAAQHCSPLSLTGAGQLRGLPPGVHRALCSSGVTAAVARRTPSSPVASSAVGRALSQPRSSTELVWGDLCALLTHPQSLRHALERAHSGHWLPQELRRAASAVRRGRQQLGACDRLSEG